MRGEWWPDLRRWCFLFPDSLRKGRVKGSQPGGQWGKATTQMGILVRFSVTVINTGQKQLGEERVYFAYRSYTVLEGNHGRSSM